MTILQLHMEQFKEASFPVPGMKKNFQIELIVNLKILSIYLYINIVEFPPLKKRGLRF